MAKNTLNSQIEKQKRKKSFNAAQADAKALVNADLSKVIDYMADREEYSKSFEAKGFTREEVKQAAKFTLQAGAYDIDVRHLDVEDSPIYYKMTENKKRNPEEDSPEKTWMTPANFLSHVRKRYSRNLRRNSEKRLPMLFPKTK